VADPFDVWKDITGIFSGVADTAHAIDAVGAALSAFGALISDKFMWRSLGWILIGAIVMIAGILSWMKKAGFEPPVPPIPIPV
jgi:hypothetical protein